MRYRYRGQKVIPKETTRPVPECMQRGRRKRTPKRPANTGPGLTLPTGGPVTIRVQPKKTS